jgi:exodeoxyribonuclease VII large subunit
VQGTGAAEEIAGAIAKINKIKTTDTGLRPDIIVLCGGGGSLEDLWAFNEECVARAIAGSSLPIVTAIGHEVDFTIADFCADLRAPTPTGAAEQIVPDRARVQRQLLLYKRQLATLLLQKINDYSRQVSQNRRLLGDLGMTLSHFTLRIDHSTSRLTHALERLVQEQTLRLERTLSRLQQQSPAAKVTMQTERLRHAGEKLCQQMQVILQQKSAAFFTQAALLDTVSPLATLARGYAIVRRKKSGKKEEEIISRSSQVNPGEAIEIVLHDGRLECEVNEVVAL